MVVGLGLAGFCNASMGLVGATHRALAMRKNPVLGDVGDDLLDTYKDVKAGCLLCEQGRLPLALWHWSLMHRIHWGKHAVGALAALHAAWRAN